MELPCQRGSGIVVFNAVIYLRLEVRPRTAIDVRVLREDVDGLVTQSSQAIRKDVTCIAIFRAVII